MAQCNHCGAQVPDGAAFCNDCGASMNPRPYSTNDPGSTWNCDGTAWSGQSTQLSRPSYSPVPVSTEPRMPVAARVLSIVAMACGICSCASLFVGFPFSIAAFICAALSNKKNTSGLDNKKARIGLITGIIGIVVSTIWLILYIALIAYVVDNTPDSYSYSYGYGYNYY